MQTGDRVRYIGPSRLDWHGIDATVTAISSRGRIEVKFDRSWGISDRGREIRPEDLEAIRMIDTTRPIRFTDSQEHDRQCLNVGRIQMPGQPERILVMSTYDPGGRSWDEPMQFNLDGTPNIRKGGAGSALRIENVPFIDSGFYPMDLRGPLSNTRGLTVLSGIWSDYPMASFALEIIRTDGTPTEAKIHARPSAS
jgi:hypothetical protein